MNSKEFACKICELLKDYKAEDTLLIDVKEKTSICDYYVIAGGRSMTHTKALAERLDEEVEKNFSVSPVRSEGVKEGRWAVIDYGDVLVHIFNNETRILYGLEKLWEDKDGKNVIKF